jgi:signal transduction histidine kinase
VGRSEEITEIVTTLLENAAQHAPGSPVWIATRDLRGSIELTVSDVGPGIPPEVGDSVFAWGRRGPDSRGEGIGLCVAKRLAEGMGGALTCVPTNGCGAIFVVQLEGARKAHDATNVGA